MEFDENKEDEIEPQYADDEYVDIYSKRAIFGFSIFSFVFAGVLLLINLNAAGLKKAMLQVIAFLVFYYIIATLILANSGIHIDVVALRASAQKNQLSPEQWRSVTSLLALNITINVICGLILSAFFFKKYFPDNDYYAKPILRPLLIFIILWFTVGMMF